MQTDTDGNGAELGHTRLRRGRTGGMARHVIDDLGRSRSKCGIGAKWMKAAPRSRLTTDIFRKRATTKTRRRRWIKNNISITNIQRRSGNYDCAGVPNTGTNCMVVRVTNGFASRLLVIHDLGQIRGDIGGIAIAKPERTVGVDQLREAVSHRAQGFLNTGSTMRPCRRSLRSSFFRPSARIAKVCSYASLVCSTSASVCAWLGACQPAARMPRRQASC